MNVQVHTVLMAYWDLTCHCISQHRTTACSGFAGQPGQLALSAFCLLGSLLLCTNPQPVLATSCVGYLSHIRRYSSAVHVLASIHPSCQGLVLPVACGIKHKPYYGILHMP